MLFLTDFKMRNENMAENIQKHTSKLGWPGEPYCWNIFLQDEDGEISDGTFVLKKIGFRAAARFGNTIYRGGLFRKKDQKK